MRAFLAAILLTATAASAQQIASERFEVASDNAPLTWNTGPYAYDATGNISAIGSQYFLYDTTGRLATAHVVTLNASATQSYSYDPYGNLTALTGYGMDASQPASASTNHLTAATGAQYDGAGNLVQSGTSVVYKYGYDAAGMMTTLRTGADANPYTVTYVYDADDQRVLTADLSANDSHFTIRDLDGAVLTDLELKGTTWSHGRDYVYRDGDMTAATSPTGAQYFSLDHLGSPRLVTDGSGYVLAFQTFLPYGQELGQPAFSDGAVKKFTGHERDADPAGAGDPLDYMHARYYNDFTGRFLSVDPVLGNPGRPQSWNRYSYVQNNPTLYTDPTGLTMGPMTCDNNGNCQVTVWNHDDENWQKFDSIHDFFQWYMSLENPITGMSQREQLRVTGHALEAFADGVVPFGDPFAANGAYDEDELGLEYSRTIGEITRDVELTLAGSGGASRAIGPVKNWIRVGPSYSRTLNQRIAMSVRWGASPARGGRYVRQIGSPTLRVVNQWLRGLKLPGSSWRVLDPGHFHLW